METLGLVFKVFWAPADAMLQASKKPRVLVPLLVLSLASLGASAVMFSKIDMADVMMRQAESQGRDMPPERRAQMEQFSRYLTPVIVASATIGTVAVITVLALIYFGIFTLIGREGGFKAFYAIVTLAYMPLIVRNVIAAIQATFIPQAQITMEELGTFGSLSLAIFLDPLTSSKVLYATAMMVDLIAIWCAILLVIGFKFLTPKRVGTGTRVAVVVTIYLIFSAVGVAARLIGQAAR